ncbi:putative beta-14-xylosyltransferase IRX10L [Zea mays]|nr:putative beta-14-xylosyltransferase IRX10L [Zea mays]
MGKGSARALALALAVILACSDVAVVTAQETERIEGSAGDVLEDDPVGRLKVYVYDLPSKYNKKLLKKDPRCLNHMFAAEIFMHRFLLSSAVRTFNPEEADWFYTPVYTTCDLTPKGLPLPFKSPRMMRSAIQLIATNWPYWNRSEGADHFFVTPHDFGACFHYQEEKAIGRGILPLLQRATLVQTFGQKNHVCLKDGSITIPPYAPPQKMQTHLIPPDTPRSIFVYFRGLFYDTGNDPEGGYYARGARASVWENFKNNPLFDISTDHPPTYYEDMQRSVFCLCPLGWAPWSPRLVEAVVFGCIPVIIADDIVLPFADAIPWEEIGVFVAEDDVPQLDSILTSIPTDVVLRKQRLLANPSMKQAMLFPQPAQPGDAFHQILNGLARKLPHGSNVFLKPGKRLPVGSGATFLNATNTGRDGGRLYLFFDATTAGVLNPASCLPLPPDSAFLLTPEQLPPAREWRGRQAPRPMGGTGSATAAQALALAALLLACSGVAVVTAQDIERIQGSAGDVLEDDPVGRLKVYVYELPPKYNKNVVAKDSRCLSHMFATEIFMHRFLLASAVRTLNPDEADWFYTPVYTTCDLTPWGHPLTVKSPRMMRSAIQYVSKRWPYWNRTEGADHFFVTPHDFGACFYFQEEKAIQRGVLPVLRRATLVQTFGQKNHVCLREGSITIPPYAPPHKIRAHIVPPETPRSIFVYFRGLFYDTANDPEGGYYARGARASVWENFKNNALFDISTEHPPTYYEDMQRAIFCLCPLGWAPWSPRLVEAVVFGCIPVIIADDIVLPFADAIPWEEIAVFVPEDDVLRLDTILTSIPMDEILRKQRLLANPSMKQAMLFPQPAEPRDAFHQVLNGLARKLPHPKDVFLKPGQKVLNWTEGAQDDLKPW